MNSKILACLVILPLLSLAQDKPPVFPDQYELAFKEKASIGPLSGNTTGKIYMDVTNNRELITR